MAAALGEGSVIRKRLDNGAELLPGESAPYGRFVVLLESGFSGVSRAWSGVQVGEELVDDPVPLALDGENLVDLVVDKLQWRSLAKILDLHQSIHLHEAQYSLA